MTINNQHQTTASIASTIITMAVFALIGSTASAQSLEVYRDEHGNPHYIDVDGDGVAEWRHEYEYNDQGQMLVERYYLLEEIQWEQRYEVDESGRLTVWLMDDDADGTLDRRIELGYDDTGRMSRYEADTDGDGEVELGATITYDDDGRVIAYEQHGAINVRREYDYDGTGRLIEYRRVGSRPRTVTYEVQDSRLAAYTRDDQRWVCEGSTAPLGCTIEWTCEAPPWDAEACGLPGPCDEPDLPNDCRPAPDEP